MSREEDRGNKNLSIDNGVHYVDLDNLTEREREMIDEYWDEIVNFMDNDDMEITNNITDVYATNIMLDDKVQYLKDYLSIAKYDLILG